VTLSPVKAVTVPVPAGGRLSFVFFGTTDRALELGALLVGE